MESLYSEDGQHFIRSLAQFIRQHEKALANSLQLSVHRRQSSINSSNTSLTSLTTGSTSTTPSSSASSLAAAFSFSGLNFMSHNIKAAHLTLTPHHLFYILSRIEELGISVGPMNVRVETLDTDHSSTNYVSFLQTRKGPSKGRSDRDSLHSVSSMRSVMSSMSAFWSSIGLGSSSSKSEKAKAAVETDLKYLYSAFTKLPSLRLTSDHRARLIQGYEEFPFDTAVPLFAFKNVQQLDIVDIDFRQFQGWDRLAEQLSLLTVKRAQLNDPTELLTDIVLDDAEKRRRRTNKGNKGAQTPVSSWTVPSTPRAGYGGSHSDPGSPAEGSPGKEDLVDAPPKDKDAFVGSVSPQRPSPSRNPSQYRHMRTYSSKAKRSESGSSNSSEFSFRPYRSESASNLLSMNILPTSKWQKLKYLSLADNSLTHISAKSLAPIATTLRSLNLSSNLFTEIPESLASLTRLTSLDLSNCMIESLQSLTRSPLPAILTLKLKSNRLQSLAGVERLLSLENLNVQDNLLSDPMEVARLTGIPNLRRIWLKHNPFTKAYSDYRIRSFNLFRMYPGYVEDIIIDDHGPGYSEKRFLVDRTPEVERRISPPVIHFVETPIVKPDSDTIKSNPPALAEVARIPSQRRKAPRRRIVDLAQDESFVRARPDDTAHSTSASSLVIKREVPSINRHQTAPSAIPKITESFKPGIAAVDFVNIIGSDSNDQRDDYRAKVEALRQEFGSNWLSALGEQNWYHDHQIEVERNHDLRHTSLHRANSHAVVTVGRTIG